MGTHQQVGAAQLLSVTSDNIGAAPIGEVLEVRDRNLLR